MLLLKSVMIRLFITIFFYWVVSMAQVRCCSQADYHSFVPCCVYTRERSFNITASWQNTGSLVFQTIPIVHTVFCWMPFSIKRLCNMLYTSLWLSLNPSSPTCRFLLCNFIMIIWYKFNENLARLHIWLWILFDIANL